MKKVLLTLIATASLLVACQSGEAEEKEIKNEDRDESVRNINDNMDFVFATDSLTDVWHIEDHIIEGEDIDTDRLFLFTDEYILDEENFESLNEYEQGLAMKTTAIISKCIEGKYDDDVELFEDDIEEYYDILKNGDDFFID